MIHNLKPYPAYKDSGVIPRNTASSSSMELETKRWFFEAKESKR
jgi:hypothetical protein